VRAIRRDWQVGRTVPENRYRSWRTVECGEQYSRFPRVGLLNESQNESAHAGRGRASNRPPSSSPQGEIPSAAAGFWDRVSCRSRDTPDSAAMPYLDDRSFPRQQKSSRSCTGLETCARAVFLLCSLRTCVAASRFFDCGERLLLALIRLQRFLAQPQPFWSDFHELIVGDEFDRLLEI